MGVCVYTLGLYPRSTSKPLTYDSTPYVDIIEFQ